MSRARRRPTRAGATRWPAAALLWLAIALAVPSAAGAAALTVTPGLAARGDAVTIDARGFAPRARGSATLRGAAGRRFRVDARGRATIVLRLRRSTRTGPRTLRVRAGARHVATTLTVLARRSAPSSMAALTGGQRILLIPDRGHAGERLELRVSGIGRRAPLKVRLATATLADTRADTHGRRTVRVSVPPLAPGATRLRVTSRRSVLALRFDVLPTAPPPPPPPPPPAPPDPVIAAAGDIACSPNDPAFNGGAGTATACRQRATSDLLVGAGLSAVLALGDNQYDCASASDFAAAFGPTWGRVRELIRPTPGNHEYVSANPDAYGASVCSAGAQGYFSYFGAAAGDPARGYYSFDVGAWHVVSLNTNLADTGSCPIVSCAAGSEQEQWLRADLAAHPAACTLAYWHHPLFSSSTRSNASRPFWDALYAAGADVVLNGHVHVYERFAPQRPDGSADPVAGMRQFVVGTGGKSVEDLNPPAANEQMLGNTYGVLELTLHAGSYDWRFRPIAGETFGDAGSSACH